MLPPLITPSISLKICHPKVIGREVHLFSHPHFSQQKLVLNIGYQPDQSSEDIYNSKVSTKQLIFEVPLPLQDLNNGQEPRAYLPTYSEYKKFTGAYFKKIDLDK